MVFLLLNSAMLLNEGAKFIRLLQLNGYKLWATLKQFLQPDVMFLFVFMVLSSGLISAASWIFVSYNVSQVYSLILLSAYMITFLFLILDTHLVKGLVFTKRVIRLSVLTSIIFLSTFVAVEFVLFTSTEVLAYAFVCVVPIIGFLSIILASVLLYPIEKAIQLQYKIAATNKMKTYDVLTIGITGSYGKTSTKNFLDVILSEKYVVLSTPKSFNTPMGVTKTILKDLRNQHEIFIVEMGADKTGDIAELCRIVPPKYGVITSVGLQHLKTFKSIENIEKTKYEIVESLPKDGIAFFNLDNDICLKLFNGCGWKKIGVSTLGITSSKSPILRANKIHTDENGMSFCIVNDGVEIEFHTKVLGTHNITNILLALAIAIELKLTPQQMIRGVSKIRPVPHRLELSNLPSGDLLIDDAFNSNIEGFKSALNVVNMYQRRKIVVTPGVIDLGCLQEEENYMLGQELARVSDRVVLVKKTNRETLRRGLIDAGFDRDMIEVADNFEQAQKIYSKWLDGKSIVLLENDLPDNYS